MNIIQCNSNCSIEKAARDTFLSVNESVFDAANDFNNFIELCYKTCPYKEVHNSKET